MSYILEALKKSDKKRKQGKVPDLDTVQTVTPPEREKRLRWPYFLLGALVLNALVFAVYLGRITSKETGITAEQNHKQSQSSTPQNRGETAPPNETADPLPSYELQKMAIPVVKTVDRPGTNLPLSSDLEQDGEGGMSEERPGQRAEAVTTEAGGDPTQNPETAAPQQSASFQEEPAARALEEDSPDQNTEPEMMAEFPDESDQQLLSGQENAAEEESADILPPASSGEAEEGGQLFRGTARERKISASENSDPEIVGINQLPQYVRKELPEIKISVHFYAKRPEARIVSINGRVMKEGQLISSGLKLDEIVADGIILSYEGRKFKVGVF